MQTRYRAGSLPLARSEGDEHLLSPCIYPFHSIERNIMYGQHITISGPFASAVDKVTAALKIEGFGILSDGDVLSVHDVSFN